MLTVSVICTVFNEQGAIQRLLTSLADQSRPPDQVVICDGGSQDGTIQLIEEYRRHHADRLPKLTLLVEPGANISRGRNLAIAAAHGPIIAVTDAGVRLDPRWLENLIAPWLQENARFGVAGFFLPDVEGVFQTAMAATVLPLPNEINPQTFLPSSRSVAFTKAAWQSIGGYPEWLDYCEDLLFDFKMNERYNDQLAKVETASEPKKESAFIWAPTALVYFRPRESLRSFWTQYYRYARGDGKADLWRKRHAIRYATYLLALPLLLWAISFREGAVGFPEGFRLVGWLGLILGIIAYCLRPWQRLGVLGQPLSTWQKFQAALLVPIIRVVGDVAKMVGYPVGCWWRYWKEGRGADFGKCGSFTRR